MQYCFDPAPAICATFSDAFPFWEVSLTALITAITIMASVLLAKRAARHELRRFQEADQFERRSRAIATFAEMCADLLHGSSKGDWDRFRFRKMTYMSRITVDSRGPELSARLWMQNASAEIIAGIDPTVTPPNFGRAIEIMDERIDNLRGWATFPGTWAEYLVHANVRPVPEKFV